MLVAVGSLNMVKIEAVKEAFEEFYSNVIIKAIDARYNTDQPLSLEDTVRGAIHRAKIAKGYAEFGVGIEAGLMSVLDYHLNIQVAAIIKDDIAIGFSPAFQLPKKLERLVLEGLELDKAVEMLYNIKDIGEKGGIIEVLSRNRINRKSLISSAVKMALVKIVNNEHT
ncbi:MAG: inosine/xanthosine triphosphatase [Candidatus Nitrosothermus koennekii]|nr:MAG: inosine/xanthosine triphosphatase [Candidatus Nitrosothermus koennekii]